MILWLSPKPPARDSPRGGGGRGKKIEDSIRKEPCYMQRHGGEHECGSFNKCWSAGHGVQGDEWRERAGELGSSPNRQGLIGFEILTKIWMIS